MNVLKCDAGYAAKQRGHVLSHWYGDEKYAVATCVFCGACVSITAKPLPNEIEMGGGAVAVDCKN